MQSVIVCCGTNGRCVIVGECERLPVVGNPVTLQNARMVLFWPAECGGLFGVAANGPKEGLRLTAAVTATSTDIVHQWLAVPDEIGEQIRAWPPC